MPNMQIQSWNNVHPHLYKWYRRKLYNFGRKLDTLDNPKVMCSLEPFYWCMAAGTEDFHTVGIPMNSKTTRPDATSRRFMKHQISLLAMTDFPTPASVSSICFWMPYSQISQRGAFLWHLRAGSRIQADLFNFLLLLGVHPPSLEVIPAMVEPVRLPKVDILAHWTCWNRTK